MKKSLSRILARMAKDGDVETVAEILGEMIDPEGTAPEAGPGTAAASGGGGRPAAPAPPPSLGEALAEG